MKPDWKTLYKCLLINAAILSLVFIFKDINQDFFQLLYVGRGIFEGKGAYNDFLDNKGIVVYLFFYLFYFLFRSNYIIILFLSLTMVSTLTSYFLIKTFYEKTTFSVLLLTAVLQFLFNMNYMSSGFFSETLGVMFICIAFFSAFKGKPVLTGIFFILGTFSRQTLFFYGLVLSTILFYRYSGKKLFSMYLSSFFTTLALLGIIIYNNHGLSAFIYNTILLNLTYAGSVTASKWSSILNISLIEVWIPILFFISIGVFIYLIYRNKRNYKQIFLLVSFLISSFLSTFIGGVVYLHHLLQFLPFSIFIISDLLKNREIKVINKYHYQLAALCIFLFLPVLLLGQSFNASDITSINIFKDYSKKQYLQMITYYPQVYIELDKNSPDKNFHPLYMLKRYNTNNKVSIEEHLALDPNKVKDTLFVSAVFKKTDSDMTKEYLDYFKDGFKLKLIKTIDVTQGSIYLFESELNT